jgi:hypothetical protein
LLCTEFESTLLRKQNVNLENELAKSRDQLFGLQVFPRFCKHFHLENIAAVSLSPF